MSVYNHSALIVDDSSPDITYSIPVVWSHGQVDPSLNAYNNTLSSVEEPGFSFSFDFEGVAIEVYGTVEAGGARPSSEYTVAGFTGLFDAPTVNETVSRVLFWRSPVFERGSYTLVGNINAVHSRYFLDYLIYSPGMLIGTRDELAKRSNGLDGLEKGWTESYCLVITLGWLVIMAAYALITFLRRRGAGKASQSGIRDDTCVLDAAVLPS